MEPEKKRIFSNWLMVNILLPLTPFLIKGFIDYFTTLDNIRWDLNSLSPDLIFFSITICVIFLNINLDSTPVGYEFWLRIFIYIVLLSDFMVLGLTYTSVAAPEIEYFLYVSVIFPFAITPIIKLRDLKKNNNGGV
jgi:hypothetical protein